MILKIIILLLLSFISGLLTYYIYRLDGKIPGKYGLIAYFDINNLITQNQLQSRQALNLAKFYRIYSIFFLLYIFYLVINIFSG